MEIPYEIFYVYFFNFIRILFFPQMILSRTLLSLYYAQIELHEMFLDSDELPWLE